MATTIESTAVVNGGRLHHSARKLADDAVRQAIGIAGITASDLDLLVNVGLFHDRILGEPALAALIQHDVGANTEDPHGDAHGTFSFDIANGSAGVLSAMQVADGFLRAGTIDHAVIVAGDADPGHGMAPNFPHDPVGAALVCGRDRSDLGLAGFHWKNDPDAQARRKAVVRLEGGRNHLRVHQDAAFAAEAASKAAEVVIELLEEHAVSMGDIAAVAAAPFDEAFVDELTGHLDIAPDRVIRPAPTPRFHTAGLIAAVAEAATRPSVPGGEWVLLVAAGAGLSVGAALWRR